MHRRLLSGVFLAAVVLSACQFFSGLPGNPTSSGRVSGDYAYIYEIPPTPIQVSATPDEARAVEAVVPLDGGTLTATGADGTVYQLDIPSGALQLETQISMTPVDGISGMPFGGERTYAVQLAPEGLSLYDFAVLTITPAQPLAVNEQILFGYRGTGENLVLAIPVIDSQEIKIQLLHFSGYGATNGSLAEVAPARQNMGGDVGSRMESAIAEGAQAERQGAGELGAEMEGTLRQSYDTQVKPTLKNAATSCAAGRKALIALQSAMRQAQLIGSSLSDELAKEVRKLIGPVAEQCFKEEYERCQAQHIVHVILPMYLGWQGTFQSMGMGSDASLVAVDQRIRQYVEQCLRFELVFESTVVTGDPQNGYESRVKATVPMQLSLDESQYVGQAPLVNESFEFRVPDKECKVIANRGGGTFESPQLAFEVDPPLRGGEEGSLRDLILTYFPGVTSEEWGYTCRSGSFPAIVSPIWSGMFIAAHEKNASAEGGFAATDWEIFSNEYFAKKEWQVDLPDLDLVEVGTFKLYHKPGG